MGRTKDKDFQQTTKYTVSGMSTVPVHPELPSVPRQPDPNSQTLEQLYSMFPAADRETVEDVHIKLLKSFIKIL